MTQFYPRSITVAVLIAAAIAFYYSAIRLEIFASLYGFFEWMETTWFGVIGKTWGAAFAFVEAIHLLGLALLGGAVLVSDGRLLGLWFNDQSFEQLNAQTHRAFVAGLVLLIVTGVFMACAVAIKIYFMEVYWVKMFALLCGVLFVYGIRRPLIRGGVIDEKPLLGKSIAVASLMVWFTVAATGRWIGYSG